MRQTWRPQSHLPLAQRLIGGCGSLKLLGIYALVSVLGGASHHGWRVSSLLKHTGRMTAVKLLDGVVFSTCLIRSFPTDRDGDAYLPWLEGRPSLWSGSRMAAGLLYFTVRTFVFLKI